ncbi:MAG: histidinol-phosphate transaminase [Candidatus Omnitrophica bacterium]|nr:histidinol-phosphate transaminase [Candidatus Omnitrophota bacterium]
MEIMTKRFFKDYVQAIVPYEPGKPIEEVERELELLHVTKLASNENPLGPSRKALRAMRVALRKVHLYPDGSGHELKERLSQEFHLPADQFVLGNGSNEIIELLARGFLNEGDRVISSETSFLVYPLIAQTCGASFVPVPMKDFRYDLKGILDQVDERTRLIFIANPNNPTGTYVKVAEVEDFLSKVPKDVIVCFDEAYIDFVEAKDFPYLLFHVKANKPNVVLLRTFSKSFGLAGLRIGYGMASREMAAYLNKVRQPFNVNRIAQIGACAALDDRHFLWRSKRLISRGRLYLYRKFTQMGLPFVSSEANFVLVDLGREARKVSEALMKRGVIVRAMNAYGLPTHIRVTIGTRFELMRFVHALKRALKKEL